MALTEKLSVCTDGLTNRGMNLVRSNINQWMSTEEKDAATVMIKQEFSNFLPCLSNLLPASPYSQQLQQNVQSNVKPFANLSPTILNTIQRMPNKHLMELFKSFQWI